MLGEAPDDDRRDRRFGAVFRPRDLDVAVAEGRHRGEGLLHGDGRVVVRRGVRRRAPPHCPGLMSGECVEAAGGLQEERGEGPRNSVLSAAPRHLAEAGCVQRLLGVLDRGLAWAAVEYRQGVFTRLCRSMIRPNGVGARLGALGSNRELAVGNTLEIHYFCGVKPFAFGGHACANYCTPSPSSPRAGLLKNPPSGQSSRPKPGDHHHESPSGHGYVLPA